ncbi:MAG: aspartate--ammonia ligase [Ruminococcaceae bacterium]|nr:aspartate--ammonia ligase [Oscillospiraceae bacterium]
MSKTVIPEGYRAKLDLYCTQDAISIIKRTFQETLAMALNLKRVSAPLFVDPNSGLNDDLNGYERPVRFDILETGCDAVVVHSLAKWKRMALYRYKFYEGRGLYTDMNAIRRDEEMDNLHSIYVDQWDWEKVITRENRTMDYLIETVQRIVDALCITLDVVSCRYPEINTKIERKLTVVSTQELEDLYPDLTPKQRENEFTKKYRTVFISQVGKVLKSGKKHDGRAPDYDDWDLNGDIMIWSDVLNCAIEISSMGIRVDQESLDRQLRESGCDDRRELLYHKMLLDGTLPLTIGGGVGQSRLCMLLLGKCHVGEVQASIWDDETRAACEAAGVELL